MVGVGKIPWVDQRAASQFPKLTSPRNSPWLDLSLDGEVAVSMGLIMVEQRHQAVREGLDSGDPIVTVAAQSRVFSALHQASTGGGLEQLCWGRVGPP